MRPLSGHRYIYANLDSVGRADPTGYFSIEAGLIALGIVIVAALLIQKFNRLSLASKETPTGRELLSYSQVRVALANAWAESNPIRDLGNWTPNASTHEEGGWIYMNPENGYVDVVRAPRSNRANSISLRDPKNRESSGMVLVANFHTHPFPLFKRGIPESQQIGTHKPVPSGADIDNNRCFGVPGIIVTHDQNLLVAPQRRTTGWGRAFGSNHAYPTYIDHCGRGFSDPWATRQDINGYYYE